MRLKQIKLAGFKSFVDPTVVKLPGARSAVVGPNGCGKSNIIDAVRWVMGESSAKQLRGESITDVIFNGSSARKPTALASIELLFDNSDGRIGGEYASYADIAIRRQVSRDAQSAYFINGRKCRRRDILDVFLGTGFGPRSYSIIEQGMISQLVEAKPEELRVYLEEAAGISKYKERRRETENRIRHTVENLDRLNDIREELDKQLAKLKRQAAAAERYRELKETERRLTAELYTLRLVSNGAALEGQQQSIDELETKLAKKQAEIQSVDTQIEKARQEYTERSEAFNSVQGTFYQLGADIARVEEALQFNKQRVSQLELDLDSVAQQDSETARQLELDDTRITELQASIDALTPRLEQARADDDSAADALAVVERDVQDWQTAWDAFSAAAAQAEQDAQVQAARIDHVEHLLQRLRGRVQQLEMEAAADIGGEQNQDVGALEAAIAAATSEQQQLEQATEAALAQLAGAREMQLEKEQALEAARAQVHDLRHELAQLEAMQQAAFGGHNTDVQAWLDGQELANGVRLGERLAVASGWERAVEAVLGDDLQAIEVDSIEQYSAALEQLPSGSVTLIERRPAAASERRGPLPMLASLVRGVDSDLSALLDGVMAADSLAAALAARPALGAGDSVITRDGLWFGRDWARAVRGDADETGIIQRAQAIESRSAALAEAEAALSAAQAALSVARDRVPALEAERDEHAGRAGELDRRLGQLRADHSVTQVRLEEAASRRERLRAEQAEMEQQIAQEVEVVAEARRQLAAAESVRAGQVEERAALQAQRESNGSRLEAARNRARAARDEFHALNSEQQGLASHLSAANTARDRLRAQQAELETRRATLQQGIADSQQPLPELQADLAQRLERRVAVEGEVAALRKAMDAVDSSVRELEEQRTGVDASLDEVRAELESARVAREGLNVQRGNLAEQLAATGLVFDEVRQSLPEEATDSAWTEELEKMERRITRLGRSTWRPSMSIRPRVSARLTWMRSSRTSKKRSKRSRPRFTK